MTILRTACECESAFAEYAEAMDREYRRGLLLRAAKLLLAGVTLRCVCEDGTCSFCVLDRTVAEEEWEAANPTNGADLAALEAGCRATA